MTDTDPKKNFTATPNSQNMPGVVLASTSAARIVLLKKLNIHFLQDKPQIDETPLKHETPQQLVMRLAHQKAEVFAHKYPNHIIIASDQTAVFKDRPIGKPYNYGNAQQQLEEFSEQRIDFYTGLVVVNTQTKQSYDYLEHTQVYFRKLSAQIIDNYLHLEQPFECAGSFKSEGLGITLFKKIISEDPNALIGLPLIALTDIFYQMGYPLPQNPNHCAP